MYYDGQSVAKNLKTVFEWFTKSAERGNTDSAYELGLMYYHGEGVEKSLYKAVEWAEKTDAVGLNFNFLKNLTLEDCMQLAEE